MRTVKDRQGGQNKVRLNLQQKQGQPSESGERLSHPQVRVETKQEQKPVKPEGSQEKYFSCQWAVEGRIQNLCQCSQDLLDFGFSKTLDSSDR